MPKFITRLAPLLALFLFHPNSVHAQQADRPPSLNLGDAVVTGFSGTLPPDPAQQRSRGKSAIDLTFINPDGPSARVIDLARPGYVWDGRMFAAPKKFDVLAKDVGQVFGVALDDQPQPNIYLAATSVFGLNIVVRGRDGLAERRKKGGPGAGWMKGQFGLELQGGPGSIYRIDGRTGVATLLANVTLDGVPNPGPGLGNLAYDSAHKQLFVSDLYTGMIHRIDLDGRDLGSYDHGVTGLGAARLPPVPFNPRNRPNIASDRFDAEKPDTWGVAAAARRVWGLAVQGGRLYYSVVSGPQIWSVGIQPDGSFAADPRWELDVPAQAGPLPVSDIAFSQQGAMILAQRALIVGSYDYSAFTRPGEPQVFRVWLKGPNDPPSPGRWKPVPEEYAVGFAGNHRNTNGGVALGYGYGQDGTLSTAACEFSLWATAQNIRNAPALKGRLDPGGPLVVHGLTGVPASPVRNFNEPPWTSYAVDYDDAFNDPRAAGHLGSVRIYSKPCAPPAVYSGPGYPANPPYTAGMPVGPVGGGGSGCVGPDCFKVGVFTVEKKVKNNTTANLSGYTFPISVTCGGTVTPVVLADNGSQTISNIPLGTICSATENTAPLTVPTGVCPAGLSPVWSAVVAPATITVTGTSQTITVTNTLDCLPVGDLIVKKLVVNNTSANVTGWTFPIDAICGSATTSMNLPDTGSQTVTNIAQGTLCSASENTNLIAPVPAGTCMPPTVPVWSAGISSSVFIGPLPQTITVTNTLDCKPVGELIVKKVVINNTAGNVSGWTFPVTAICGSGTTPLVMTGTGSSSSQTVSNIAQGTYCSVTENTATLAVPTNACPANAAPVWSANISAGVFIGTLPQTITVTNKLDCQPVGDLIVKKVVINNTAGNVSGWTFPVNAVCGGVTTPLTMSGTGSLSSQTIGNLTAGTLCSANENTALLAVPANACTGGLMPVWSGSISSNVFTISPGSVTITVTNKLDCQPVGDLIVKKVVVNNTSGNVSGWTFPVTAICGSATTPLVMTGTGSLSSQTISNLAQGTYCYATENTATLAVPPNACTGTNVPVWSANISAAVNIGTSPQTITVTNTLDCKPVGDLIVTKTVINNTTANVSGWPFAVTATCGGVPIPLVLTGGGSQTTTGLVQGIGCTAMENTPAVPPNACGDLLMPVWTTNISAGVTIGTSPQTIAVTNQLDCTMTPPGIIDIGIVKTGGTTPACTVGAYSFTLAVTNLGAGFSNSGAIQVNDTVPSGMTFAPIVAPGWFCTPTALPGGTPFTCTYTGPSPTANQGLPLIWLYGTPTTPAPFPPYTNCAQVGLTPASGYTDTVSSNNNSCVTVAKPNICPQGIVAPPPPVCPQGTTRRGNACIPLTGCQPPMVAGAVPGVCVCPQGRTLQDGRCVTPVCPPPMVAGAVPGSCKCPTGTTQKGKECVTQTTCPQGTVKRGTRCVEPIVCRAPARLNARGTACVCPSEMVMKGRVCVERERKPRVNVPDRTPGLGIPGIERRGPGRGWEGPRGGGGAAGGGRGGGGGGSGSPGRR